MASYGIDAFKGPNVCVQRLSHVSPLHLTLVQNPEYIRSHFYFEHF